MKRYKIRMRTFQVVHEPHIDFGEVGGPEDAVPLLKAILRDATDSDKESFIVIALNARGRAIGYKIVSVGTLTASLVHAREVFGAAIALQAAAILVAHSHPSGDPTPSQEDLALTERLMQAGDIIGIPVVDHIILASSGADESPWRSIGVLAHRETSIMKRATP